jgi:hypothetical protein
MTMQINAGPVQTVPSYVTVFRWSRFAYPLMTASTCLLWEYFIDIKLNASPYLTC